MKWGVFFVKKWKMGVFCKKWKIGCFYKKSGKWGGCKKVENVGVLYRKLDHSSTQGALCTVSVFFILHFTFLGGGGAYAPNAPCLRACMLHSCVLADDDDDDKNTMTHCTQLLQQGKAVTAKCRT